MTKSEPCKAACFEGIGSSKEARKLARFGGVIATMI